MAEIVNPQVTDAITQGHVEVMASAPAHAIAALYGVLSHSIGLAAENAVTQQQAANTLLQAVTAQGVAQIYGSLGVQGK